MLEELNLHKSLKLAVKTEQIGAEFYEKMAKKFEDNKEVAEIFKRLSGDEKVHEAQFKKFLEDAPTKEGESNYEVDQFVRAIAVSEFFRIEGFRKPEKIETREDALGAALEFEKATLLFYQALKDNLGEKAPLEKIIQAEKDHIMSLSRVLVSDAKFRGIADKWI